MLVGIVVIMHNTTIFHSKKTLQCSSNGFIDHLIFFDYKFNFHYTLYSRVWVLLQKLITKNYKSSIILPQDFTLCQAFIISAILTLMQYSLYGNCDHKLVCSMQILSQYSNTKLNISGSSTNQSRQVGTLKWRDCEMITKNIRTTRILSYSAIRPQKQHCKYRPTGLVEKIS